MTGTLSATTLGAAWGLADVAFVPPAHSSFVRGQDQVSAPL
jgi:hypothetical protein